jgi:acyl-coenzyme A synthetase/AMP-(fatty) acid ligase
VVDEYGKPCSVGVVGEIVAEGENVTHGYWKDADETANCFRNGKLYTGDMGKVDEDGFFYVVDRAKDFLKCGGKRVSCRELEDAILELEDVLEAAVVGMQDDILGEAVRVFVVPRFSDCEFETLVRNHCKQRISREFQPKEIIVMKSLPKNSSGKVLKSELREMVST